MNVTCRRLHPDAIVPSQAYQGDAGFDLCAVARVELPPHGRALVPCGFAIELEAGSCALVLPRSGLAATHGVTCLNAPGLIDSGYRGELRVVLHNTDPVQTFVVDSGMRIAQLLVVALPAVEFSEATELSESERGSGGFGSSGV